MKQAASNQCVFVGTVKCEMIEIYFRVQTAIGIMYTSQHFQDQGKEAAVFLLSSKSQKLFFPSKNWTIFHEWTIALFEKDMKVVTCKG